MCAPVLLRFGTDAQKKRFLPRIYNGEDFWCQGYSEPGSGSDLASLKTKAVPPGRSLRRHRPEDLDHARALRRLDLLPRAHRRLAGQAAGRHLVPAHRHEDPRHHGATDHLDGRRARDQRGVLRRREGAGGEPRPRGGQGLDGGQVPPRLRAHGHRPHRRLQARAGPAQGAGRAPHQERQAPHRRHALPRPAHPRRGGADGAGDHQPALPRPDAPQRQAARAPTSPCSRSRAPRSSRPSPS